MAGVGVLGGVRVAVTRPQAAALERALRAVDAEVVHVPLIEIGPPGDEGRALDDALDRLADYDWLVVTSVNGVRAIGGVLGDRVLAVRVAAVGTATAQAVAAVAGRAPDLVPTVPRGEGLVAEFPGPPSRVLVAQADRAAPTVVEGLRSAGHAVDAVTAYATVTRRPTAAEAAALSTVDVVVFASGSAVHAWREAGLPDGPAVVAIGPTTADVATALGVPVDEVAAAPDPASLVAAVVRAARARADTPDG